MKNHRPNPTTTQPKCPRILRFVLITLALGAFSQGAKAADLYWDQNKGTTGTGGSGTWVTAGEWRLGSAAGTLQDWADGNNAHFAGTAGVVSISNGTTVSPVTTFFEVTSYTLTPSSSTTTTLAGSISLSAGVNLTLNDASATTTRDLATGSISGGIGSSLTISGAQTGTNYSRVQLSQANASISVPITITGSGSNVAGVIATATGTGITGTIANNSSRVTLLGATAGNDLTLSSAAVISGSAGVKIGITSSSTSSGSNAGTVTINAANMYLGGTTLSNTGTVALGNDSALGDSSGIVTITGGTGGTVTAGGGARNIANSIVLAADTTVGGSNNLTFSGSFTSSGSGSRTLTVNNSATTALSGNVFLSESDSLARSLTINGNGAVTISGAITNNNVGNNLASPLTYSGSNTLTLTGNNTYTGATSISNSGTLSAAGTGSNKALGATSAVSVYSGGTLLLGANNQIKATTPVTLGATSTTGGTLNTSGFSQNTLNRLGALTLTQNSTIDFSTAVTTNSILAFGDSSSASWGSNTLSIYNYAGTPVTGGGTDQLYFGDGSISGLKASQLGQISFYSDSGSTLLGTGTFVGSNGEVSYDAIPEPGTVFGGLALLGLVGWRERRRVAG